MPTHGGAEENGQDYRMGRMEVMSRGAGDAIPMRL